ncbi:UNVERIFIED_CONTAM: hypothetical protein Sangu_2323000 [Sesamum angustifolium]|uniref:Uncharacterized protein n=1 Tax=Sesamum angustifolium TaxID=2727405 RepID=A0AAW2LAP4_9LAMI
MKGFGFLSLLLLIGTADFVYLSCSSKGSISPNPGMVSTGKIAAASTVKSRRLKEKIDPPSSNRDDAGLVTLEDYRPIDPVPNSKASIRPGPIQHGTPLMPYIPRPSPPPGRPKHGG